MSQGDRIAQLILERICMVHEVIVVDDFAAVASAGVETDRGEKGFGSTGK